MESDEAFFRRLEAVNHVDTSEDDGGAASQMTRGTPSSRRSPTPEQGPLPVQESQALAISSSDISCSTDHGGDDSGFVTAPESTSSFLQSSQPLRSDNAGSLPLASEESKAASEQTIASSPPPLSDAKAQRRATVGSELRDCTPQIQCDAPESQLLVQEKFQSIPHSRSSSTATTVCSLLSPSPKIPAPEELWKREADFAGLAEMNSDKPKYSDEFAQFVKDSIPELGPVQKNDIGKQSLTENPGEKVSDISDDEPSRRPRTAPSQGRERVRTSRRRKRGNKSVSDGEGPIAPALKRTRTEPIVPSPNLLKTTSKDYTGPVAALAEASTRSIPAGQSKTSIGLRQQPVLSEPEVTSFVLETIESEHVSQLRNESQVQITGAAAIANVGQQSVSGDPKILNSDVEEEYEVPDSQPDAMPASPPRPLEDVQPRPPVEEAASSLEIKPYKGRQPSTPPFSEEPGRTRGLKLVKKVPSKPWVIPWDSPPRKKPKMPSEKEKEEETSPYKTPSAASQSSVAFTPVVNSSGKDALQQAMDEVRVDPGLAKDVESADERYPSDDEAAEKPHSIPAKKRSKLSPKSWQDTFSCMNEHAGTASKENVNAGTIAVLQEMADYYSRTKDEWRHNSYRKAIAALKSQKQLITNRSQASQIHGIGKSIAEKIEEIARTGHLRKLDNAREDPNDATMKLFLNIYGAGISQARSWIAQGFTTLDDLRKKAKLTTNQQIGLDHYEDFQSRIPRNEIHKHFCLVDGATDKISWKLKVEIAGSHRRGAETSGDIDFLVTSRDETMPDHALHAMVFEDLIPRLFKSGYLKATLASSGWRSSSSSSGGESGGRGGEGRKWHGAACLPGPEYGVWRRVDFLMVPPREWGAALLYFTGSDLFNRSMRLLARKKGMLLNQHGLYKDVLRNASGEAMTKGTLLEAKSEKRIFELLEVPYRPPQQRNC